MPWGLVAVLHCRLTGGAAHYGLGDLADWLALPGARPLIDLWLHKVIRLVVEAGAPIHCCLRSADLEVP